MTSSDLLNRFACYVIALEEGVSKLELDLYVAAFRVGLCDFVDHSFWPRKEDDPRNHTN